MIFMPIIMYRFNKILITKLLYTSIYKDKYFLHLLIVIKLCLNKEHGEFVIQSNIITISLKNNFVLPMKY